MDYAVARIGERILGVGSSPADAVRDTVKRHPYLNKYQIRDLKSYTSPQAFTSGEVVLGPCSSLLKSQFQNNPETKFTFYEDGFESFSAIRKH